jgi:2-polyprenyl-3-methyl-5-hydroxy-6-metoxy-1,4-benzoquinol methylase
LIAGNYDVSEEPFREIHRENLRKTKKYLNPGDVVLDFGCGTGNQSIGVAGDVKEVYGIDISSKMIEIAKLKLDPDKNPNVHFTHTTLFDGRLKNESFDVILAFNILHYLEDTQEVMRRINELLKPGGFFISSTECMGEENKKKLSRCFSLGMLSIMSKVRMLSAKFFKFSELENLIFNGNFQIFEAEKLKLRDLRYYFIAAKKI